MKTAGSNAEFFNKKNSLKKTRKIGHAAVAETAFLILEVDERDTLLSKGFVSPHANL